MGLLFGVGTGSAPSDSWAAPKWETVARDNGVLLMSRQVPGRSFPTFRATWVMKENLFDVLAVLRDVPRHPEWMSRAKDSRLLRKKNEFEYVVYSRTDSPWPVDDRDAVFFSRVSVHPDQRMIMVSFKAVKNKKMPPKDGIVRMTKLRGYYALKMIGPQKTRVDYELDADPGGWIPTWVGKITAKNALLDTRKALKRQVQKTRGSYPKRIERWKKLAKLPPL